MQNLATGFPAGWNCRTSRPQASAQGNASRPGPFSRQRIGAPTASAGPLSRLPGLCCCNAPSKKSFSWRTKSQEIRIQRASAVLAFEW